MFTENGTVRGESDRHTDDEDGESGGHENGAAPTCSEGVSLLCVFVCTIARSYD